MITYSPKKADILFLDSVPTYDDCAAQSPFSGSKGKMLEQLCAELGIDSPVAHNIIIKHQHLGEWKTLFSKYTDKNATPSPALQASITEVWKEISATRPNIIVGFGELVLWALTQNQSITKWRGSMFNITSPIDGSVYRFIPTYDLDAARKQWPLRTIIRHDMGRALSHSSTPGTFAEPKWNFIIRPSFEVASTYLSALLSYLELSKEPVPISIDIETKGGFISCCGIALSENEAICIPFSTRANPQGYWSEPEEIALIQLFHEVFKHPRAYLILQNGLYDFQYFSRQWLCNPKCSFDTMLAQHTLWCEMPKGLDFLSSLYCQYHMYWKDEGKDFDDSRPEEDNWRYNCKDAVATFEVWKGLSQQLASSAPGVQESFRFQMERFHLYFKVMQRGVRVDREYKDSLVFPMMEAANTRLAIIEQMAGRELNPGSPKQMVEFFYEYLGLKPIKGKTGNPTCDEKALILLSQREPLVAPLVNQILELRSLNVVRSTFVNSKLDEDGRARCSYNISGTSTFRLSSSKNAFGSGGNMQNIPAVPKKESVLSPNVRAMYIPDQGYLIADADLDRADLQVVVWEADDKDMKAALRMGLDMHCVNACDIFGVKGIPYDELKEDHPNYPDHRGRIGEEFRSKAKAGVHATNYYAQPPTLAKALGITVREAALFQRNWFGAHPGIPDWHSRIEQQLLTTRRVSNKFGYSRFFFDRIENIMPEAIAWIPQSTVGIVIDKALTNLESSGLAEVLIQVHDSGVFQFPKRDFHQRLPKIREAMLIEIPYDDPLVIPVGLKLSAKSWGHCKATDWDYAGEVTW